MYLIAICISIFFYFSPVSPRGVPSRSCSRVNDSSCGATVLRGNGPADTREFQTFLIPYPVYVFMYAYGHYII